MKKITDKKYDFISNERKWQKFWSDKNIYHFDEDDKSNKKIFSIDTPPPTISGNIHIGHIFSYTQAEVLARYKRMSGYNVFYPFGFDDNGLPTEKLVEKETGKKSSNTDRKDYIKLCLDVTDKYRNVFQKLFEKMGFSADWRYNYSTISNLSQNISQKSFLKLFKEGHIERTELPGIYCTECKTTIAQAEVDGKDKATQFIDIIFKLENGKEIVIATTRPELIEACVAVFVNPEDDRYKDLLGKKIITPLGDKVSILSDEKVLKDKGSGAVMCCTYGDETDLYWVKKYSLEEKIIIDKDGFIKDKNHDEQKKYKVTEYRKIIIKRLDNISSIKNINEIEHSVGVHERCGTPIEILPVKQWIVKVKENKKKFIELADQIDWNPSHMKSRYVNWVDNLTWEWSISRQRGFGIPIPVWYCKNTGKIVTPDLDELPIDPQTQFPKKLPEGLKEEDLIPEKDVLDTWATSALTPQINAKWGNKDDISDKILPMGIRPHAHDIIRTWTFYTIVKSWLHNKQIPWKSLMISGHVKASKKEKISKSKGNEKETPDQLIDKYSADGVRYWTTGVSLGKDIILESNEMVNGERLVIKIFNAAKFVSMNLEDFSENDLLKIEDRNPIDKWILQRLQRFKRKALENYDKIQLNKVKDEFELFFYNDFCANYLESVKGRVFLKEEENISKEKEFSRKSAQSSLYQVLYQSLCIIAPILPHITEEIYQKIFFEDKKHISIHKIDYSLLEDFPEDKEVDKIADDFFKVIQIVRKYKSENHLKHSAEIEKVLIKCDEKAIYNFENSKEDLIKTLNINLLTFSNQDKEELEVIIS